MGKGSLNPWRETMVAFAMLFGVLWGSAQTQGVSEVPVSETDVSQVVTPDKEDAEEVHQLHELVVNSRRAVIEDNKIIVVPTKTEKKLSNSPASLIDQMQFPGLKVKDGQITGLDGQGVTIYINGVAATDIDYETFWPKNAVRVEYIINPTEQSFDGASRVLNFIVNVPETGGVTKLSAYQYLPNFGSYRATSKLTYKAMSYGFTFSGGYSRDHSSRTEGEETFEDLYYSGELYDRISRTFKGNDVKRYNDISTAINARYYTEKLTVVHTLGLLWKENPGSYSNASQLWNPNLFDSYSAFSSSSSHSLTPQISGSYRYSFSKLFSMVGSWRYKYTNNNMESLYSQTGLTALSNATKETTNELAVSLEPRFGKNGKWVVSLPLNLVTDWFDTQYSGTANTSQKMTRQTGSASISGIWAITPQVTVQLNPGISITHTSIGDISQVQIVPKLDSYVYWMPTSRLWMNLYVRYMGDSQGAPYMNPVTTQESDLLWQKGNPYLKSKDYFSIGFGAGYLLSNSCELSISFGNNREKNFLMRTYSANGIDKGGLTYTFENTPLNSSFYIWPEVSISFLNNKLRLRGGPRFNSDHFSSETAYYKSDSRFYGEGNLTGYLGNFSIMASYTTPWKYLSQGGASKLSRQSTVSIMGTYGTGDLYVSVGIMDIFHTRAKVIDEFHGAHYSNILTTSEIGRKVDISLSYFFGYGKKVDRSIDIESVSAGPSSVL